MAHAELADPYQLDPAAITDPPRGWLAALRRIGPGVVLSASIVGSGELIATTARLNNALRRLGSGWALFVDAERREAADYPESVFPEPLSWLVDEERTAPVMLE